MGGLTSEDELRYDEHQRSVVSRRDVCIYLKFTRLKQIVGVRFVDNIAEQAEAYVFAALDEAFRSLTSDPQQRSLFDFQLRFDHTRVDGK